MQPRDRLTVKEIQVASLVWQGLTNKDIAAVLRTSEQVVKNYLRTTFDKLGVWTRLELALYVASHGGTTWQRQFGRAWRCRRSGGAREESMKPFHSPMERRARQPRRVEQHNQGGT